MWAFVVPNNSASLVATSPSRAPALTGGVAEFDPISTWYSCQKN